MCDVSTLQEIEIVVLEKAQKGEMFSAHDITKEVRKKVGRGVNVPHSDVKQEVHNLFLNGQMGTDYTRTVANLPGVSLQPFVYHRTTDDPVNYQGNVSQTVVTATPVSDDGVNQTASGSYKVDGRETLCLPANLLRDVGLTPGDTARVAVDALAGVLVVSKTVLDENVYSLLTTYTTDRYGNVRVTQAVLRLAGLGGKEYDITGDNVQVSVSKVA